MARTSYKAMPVAKNTPTSLRPISSGSKYVPASPRGVMPSKEAIDISSRMIVRAIQPEDIITILWAGVVTGSTIQFELPEGWQELYENIYVDVQIITPGNAFGPGRAAAKAYVFDEVSEWVEADPVLEAARLLIDRLNSAHLEVLTICVPPPSTTEATSSESVPDAPTSKSRAKRKAIQSSTASPDSTPSEPMSKPQRKPRTAKTLVSSEA